MLEEFSNPTLLEEQVDQENFIDIMCKTYTEEQIIKQLYKKKFDKKTYRKLEKVALTVHGQNS